MLGNSAYNLKYQSINDFQTSSDYLDYMFGGMKGVCYRATINPKYHQEYYRSSGLIKARYEGVDNVYVAMNTFYRKKGLDRQEGREVSLLKRLNALYVDIDCYKLGLSKKEVLLRLEDDFYDSKIPVPTFVIDSGRGIYLIWKIRNEDKNALPRWNTVSQYLTDTLVELGADQACTDGARILRVPFSRNPKSNSMVSIEEFNDRTYSINEIKRKFGIKPKKWKTPKRKKNSHKKYPYNHATEKQRKYVRDIAKRLELDEASYPDFTNFHETDNWIRLHKDISIKEKCYKISKKTYSLPEYTTMKSVLISYCKDIRTLFSMRKGADCKRELALFLYRYFLRERKYSSEEALKETLAFNASLDCPFDEDYVATVTASADHRIEKGMFYAYQKSTIIKILEITEEEMKHLSFLSSGDKEKKQNKKEKNRREYEKRLVQTGKVLKKDAILKRRALILSMKESGMQSAEIQKTLHISRATYHRDLAALATESVLSAVKSISKNKTKNITGTKKNATEAISNAKKSVKKNGLTVAIRSAVAILNSDKNKKVLMSHFFSSPFIEKHSIAVPHSLNLGILPVLFWLFFKHMRISDSSSDSDSSDSES